MPRIIEDASLGNAHGDNPGMHALLALKPFLTLLVLPACSVVLALLSVLLIAQRPMLRASTRRALLWCGLLLCALWWWLAAPVGAGWLARHLLPAVATATPSQLKAQGVQAIVVLGGGVQPHAEEYRDDNHPEETSALQPDALARLVYGVWLRRQTGLPLAFSGGIGRASIDQDLTEADVAELTLQRLGLPPLRWREGASADTHQNAVQMHSLLQAEGITHIALVSHAWHLPRAQREFEAAGFVVTPAPMGAVHSDLQAGLQWLPSGVGLRDSQRVLREWLALRLLKGPCVAPAPCDR